MNSQPSDLPDRRESLLSPNEIHHWHNTPDAKFRVGVKNIGEIHMGLEACNILVQTLSGVEWINFGKYKFMFADWDNPFLLSDDGEFLILHWVYFHVQSAINPIIINLYKKEFCLLEPNRSLRVRSIRSVHGLPTAICNETKWTDSQQHEVENVGVPIIAPFRSIEDFYTLDPLSVETNVYIWKGKRLTITPLSEYRSKDFSER